MKAILPLGSLMVEPALRLVLVIVLASGSCEPSSVAFGPTLAVTIVKVDCQLKVTFPWRFKVVMPVDVATIELM